MENFVDYYALLGVPEDAPVDEIKKKIRALRREYRGLEGSPDPDQRNRAEQAMSTLAECERVLTDPAQRSNYDAMRLIQSFVPPTPRKSRANEHAESLLESARNYAREGKAERAVVLALEAAKNNEDNDPYIPFTVSVILRVVGQYDAAMSYAGEALKLEQDPGQTGFYWDNLGQLNLLTGDCASAASAFEAAIANAEMANDDRIADYEAHEILTMTLQDKYAEAVDAAQKTFAKYPDSQAVKNVYANAVYQYITHVIASSKTYPDHDDLYWFTNTKQIEEARKYEQILAQLGPIEDCRTLMIPGPALDGQITELREKLDKASKRYVKRPETKTIVLVLIAYLIFAFFTFRNATAGGVFLWLLVTAGIAALAYWRCYAYGWVYNKRMLAADTLKTGLQA